MNNDYIIINGGKRFCKKCKIVKCSCACLRTINRRHDALIRMFDLNKMEIYFGILNTDYSKYSISLERNGRFHYEMTFKKLNVYDPLITYIQGLPRDINNVIYSYVSETNFIIKMQIELPHNYPFNFPLWTVVKYIKDGKPQDLNEETQKARCLLKNSSPSMMIDKEILYYISNLMISFN
jgi:hypothetical protein